MQSSNDLLLSIFAYTYKDIFISCEFILFLLISINHISFSLIVCILLLNNLVKFSFAFPSPPFILILFIFIFLLLKS